MTLILATGGSQWVTQAADWRVTTVRSGSVVPFDERFNKTVLFFARDAVVSFAFTGLADLMGKPIDEWLAEVLSGGPLGYRAPGRPVMFRFRGAQRSWPDIGTATRRVSDALGTALARVPVAWRKAATVELIASGWQWTKRRRPRPICIYFNGAWGKEVQAKRLGRRHIGRRYTLAAAPAENLLGGEFDRWHSDLRMVAPELMPDALARHIRDVSGRDALVGPSCTSVHMYHPYDGRIVIRHHLDDAPSTAVGGWLTPWIVAPSIVAAPAIHTGAVPWETRIGTFLVTLAPDVLPPDDGLNTSQSLARRRP
jgi:hypothetical protein